MIKILKKKKGNHHTLAYSRPAYKYPAGVRKVRQDSTVMLWTLVQAAVRSVLDEVKSLMDQMRINIGHRVGHERITSE